MTSQRGQVIGSAGVSLDDFHQWGDGDGSAARRGQKGEVRTAAILDPLALKDGGPTVLHDLRIPLKGISANIDHAVVAGRNVLLLDTKVWRPGFYWTAGGTSRRGLTPVPHADKQTMVMAAQGVSGFLANQGIKANIVRPVVVVWPSSEAKSLHLWALSFPGANCIPASKMMTRRGVGSALLSRPWKKWVNDNADPAIVRALSTLTN